MFRKHYKAAMNDIKPNEAFVESVIKKAARKRPPTFARYTKFAAGLAAAVVIVSAAVISMPVWQKTEQNKDGIIIEEKISDNAADKNSGAISPAPTAAPSYTELPAKASAPDNNAPFYSGKTNIQAPEKDEQTTAEPEIQAETPREVTAPTESASAEKSEDAHKKAPVVSDIQSSVAAEQEAQITAAAGNEIAEDTISENAVMYSMSEAADTETASLRSAPMAAGSAKMKNAPDMPAVTAPQGYYETASGENYFEFENGSGDYVSVSAFYTGESDREADINEYEDAVQANLASGGFDISVYGTEKQAVIEIVNQVK